MSSSRCITCCGPSKRSVRGTFVPQLGSWPKDRHDYPKGVRYFEDVIARDAESYWKAWHEVTMGQLNAELAVQVHSLCIKNNVKRRPAPPVQRPATR